MEDKVVVVTGASSGIGKAVAEEYASRGAKVVLADVNYAKLKDLSQVFESNGKDHLIVQADVSVENDCRQIINEAVKKYGRIDILVNTAGISMH